MISNLHAQKVILIKIQKDLTSIMTEFSERRILFSKIISRYVWGNLKWKEWKKAIINSKVKNILEKATVIHQYKKYYKKVLIFA